MSKPYQTFTKDGKIFISKSYQSASNNCELITYIKTKIVDNIYNNKILRKIKI